METTRLQVGIYRGYSAPGVDRMCGIWGSYYGIPKAIFYLLQGGL